MKQGFFTPNLLGFPVGSLYIHVNTEVAEKRQHHYNCLSASFYGSKPKITGVIREHLLMELGPSTIGYVETGGHLSPQLEDYEGDYCSSFVTKIVQRASLEFIKDYVRIFGKYRDDMVLPGDALSAPLEYYLHYSKPLDREMFSSLLFEDALNERENLKALDFWNNEITVHGLTDEGGSGVNCLPADFSELYMDGLFVKSYRMINKWFPKSGRSRAIVKKIASAFIHG